MSTCSRCQRTVGYDCDCTPFVQCCVCGRSMTADEYQCDDVDGEASCPSCAEQARRGDFLVEQGAVPIEPLRTRALGNAVVAHPICPSCGRPVLTLIKSTNPDIARRRFVVHQGSGRCMVSPADYAQLADWFARIFTDGARRARADAAVLAEQQKGATS